MSSFFYHLLIATLGLGHFVAAQQSAQFAGLLQQDDNGQALPVPVRSIDVNMQVYAWAVAVTANLTYRNTANNTANHEFIFPLDSSAALYLLEARIGSRRIYGKVMRREDAEFLFGDALERGLKAFLIESQVDSSDVYRLLVGNLSPNETVTVTIGYVMPIIRDPQSGHIFYQIPIVLNPRAVTGAALRNPYRVKQQYHLSSPWVAAQSAAIPYQLTFTGRADVGLAGVTIRSIKAENPADRINSTFSSGRQIASFSLTNTFKPDHDLGIWVELSDCTKPGVYIAAGLPRSNPDVPITEAAQSHNEAIVGAIFLDHQMAQNLTKRQTEDEFWFILDRSRSMLDSLFTSGGFKYASKFEIAQTALENFLRSLPENSKFNILGFGGYGCVADVWEAYNETFPEDIHPERYCDKTEAERVGYVKLFDSARPKNEANFNAAVEHIQNMIPDLWGNSLILPVLQHVLEDQPPVCEPNRRNIFLISDGEVDNYPEIERLVGLNARGSNDDTDGPLKVFTVGVGDGASTELKRVARVSGGAHEIVRNRSSDRLSEKLARLMTYATSVSIDNLRISWRPNRPSVFWRSVPGQNLVELSALYGRTTLQYGMMARPSDDVTLTGTVTVTANIDGKPYRFSQAIQAEANRVSAPLDAMPLHRLAAKQRLNDMMDQYYITGNIEIKRTAIDFSVESGVLCEWTALVAIDEGSEKAVGNPDQEDAGQGVRLEGANPLAGLADPDLDKLIKLQAFNGSWPLTQEFVDALGSPNATTVERFRSAVVGAITTTRSQTRVATTAANNRSLATLAAVSALRLTFRHLEAETRFIDQNAIAFLKRANRQLNDATLGPLIEEIGKRFTL